MRYPPPSLRDMEPTQPGNKTAANIACIQVDQRCSTPYRASKKIFWRLQVPRTETQAMIKYQDSGKLPSEILSWKRCSRARHARIYGILGNILVK